MGIIHCLFLFIRELISLRSLFPYPLLQESTIICENPNISIATTTTPEKNVLKYTITQKLGSDTDEVIDTTTLGERTVTYTYTDSWGRTGTTTRKVVVRPQLYKNRIQVYSEENESLSSRSPISEDILDNSHNGNNSGNSGETEQPGGSDTTQKKENQHLKLDLIL